MATIITTGAFAKALWPGVNAWWGKAYAEHRVEYTDLFDTFKSSRNYEEDVGIASFGLPFIKDEAQTVQFDAEVQAFTTRYVHIVYGLGFVVTREMFEDDLYKVVGEKRARALAFSMRQGKEVVAANVYNRAFNATFTGGDGVTLLNTAHPLVSGGTAFNQLATNSAISEAALEQASIDIMNYTNDRGLKIAVTPQSLIVPTQLVFEAQRILGSEYRVGTPNNDINALVVMNKFPMGIKVNHYLTSTTAWFIRTDVPDGMKYFERRGIEFNMENDWDTENAKYKATERYSFGWTDWRTLYGTPGA